MLKNLLILTTLTLYSFNSLGFVDKCMPFISNTEVFTTCMDRGADKLIKKEAKERLKNLKILVKEDPSLNKWKDVIDIGTPKIGMPKNVFKLFKKFKRQSREESLDGLTEIYVFKIGHILYDKITLKDGKIVNILKK